MRWAYREELVSDISYLDKIIKRKDTPVRVKTQDKYLEKNELSALLEGMKEDRWRLLTEFLALSGLRVCEAIAILVEDVDFTQRAIHITKTYSNAIRGMASTPKTERSTRDVYMQDELLNCARRAEELFFAHRTKYFFGLDDNYISYDAYRNYLAENTVRIL